MTAAELRAALEGVPDDMPVIVETVHEYTSDQGGIFRDRHEVERLTVNVEEVYMLGTGRVEAVVIEADTTGGNQ